jgi:hypothetical protein
MCFVTNDVFVDIKKEKLENCDGFNLFWRFAAVGERGFD